MKKKHKIILLIFVFIINILIFQKPDVILEVIIFLVSTYLIFKLCKLNKRFLNNIFASLYLFFWKPYLQIISYKVGIK